MKKLFCLLLAAALLTAAVPVVVSAASITVTINGDKVDFPDQEPVIVDGRTLVPVRGVLESMGATVEWDSKTSTATFSRGDVKGTLKIGSVDMKVGTKTTKMDVAPQIIGGRTMIPIRFPVEALGGTVGWDGKTSTVIITDDYGSADDEPADEPAEESKGGDEVAASSANLMLSKNYSFEDSKGGEAIEPNWKRFIGDRATQMRFWGDNAPQTTQPAKVIDGTKDAPAHTGDKFLRMTLNKPWRYIVYQFPKDLANGTYTASVWVRTNAKFSDIQSVCEAGLNLYVGKSDTVKYQDDSQWYDYMEQSQFMLHEINSPASEVSNPSWKKVGAQVDWFKIEITDIQVEGGQLFIGLYGKGRAGDFVDFDDLCLIKVK